MVSSSAQTRHLILTNSERNQEMLMDCNTTYLNHGDNVIDISFRFKRRLNVCQHGLIDVILQNEQISTESRLCLIKIFNFLVNIFNMPLHTT